MSDLDADLYGDLYGNDEADNEQPQEEIDANPPAEEAATEMPVKAESPEVSVKPAAEKPYTNGTIPQAPPTNGVAQVTYTQPAPQQIPTYEQPQPNEYREVPTPRTDGGFQNIATGERSIRPSEMKDEGKMFIGGLNWDTTDESLREYFTQFGKVDACTIMRDAAGRSRCFAFLTFEEPASVNAVMVREHYLDGKIIDPKRAIPRQEHQRATKLFIGGLAGSVTSESMREFFSQFGKVIDSTVMLDRETGRSKGFGFVSFEDTNVQSFLGFGNLEIDGKLIDVKLAQPRYQRDNFPHEDAAAAAAGTDFTPAPVGGGAAARFNPQQANFGGAVGANVGAAGNTPFDPQALAALYTRMFQMSGAGGMNPAMMGGMGGGMNPMMAGMGGAGGFPGAMRPGMGMGMGMGGMGGAGPGMGGMGRGAQGMMGGMNPNIPRGPRGGPGGPTGAMGAAGVGPQRSQRGQHNFHPYAR
ncbi:hypothetical protein GALMADRAFT_254178 [Galerina marginata CBS 339.88]|uniref:RRM domain-containing protein n=1 Tax=Galerina marginata (strain CBS 339.88) TaxID=685588 RepID=A0A067SW98_GALM3|nr:hypothetical protein GALMADRAFT_254178 [Galerina marginata CBS 339.88]